MDRTCWYTHQADAAAHCPPGRHTQPPRARVAEAPARARRRAAAITTHASIRSMRPDPVGASCMQSVKFKSIISPLLFHARARGRRVGQLEAPAGKTGKIARSSQARFGGLTLVSRTPWLLVTGAPGLFSWPNTLWTTAVACRMSPTSRTGQAAASRRHRHRNSRGAAAARP